MKQVSQIVKESKLKLNERIVVFVLFILLLNSKIFTVLKI